METKLYGFEILVVRAIIVLHWTVIVALLMQPGCTWKNYKFSISKITIAEDKIDVEMTAEDEKQEACAIKNRLERTYPDGVIYDGDDIYIITDEGRVELANDVAYRVVSEE